MSFTLIQQATPRLHRSELAVPGSNPSLFEKAAKAGADIIFLDLEDAVAPDDKEQARKNIIQGLNDLHWGTKTMMIRINGLDTHYAYRDVVDVVENCPRLDMILIPKTGVPQDVYAIDMLVTQIEQYKKREKKIGFEVLIETALGMTNVETIAQASRRLEAMSFGVPVVASNAAALPEVCGDAALLAEPFDPAALAAAMERVLSDAPLAATLRRRGMQRAAQFTPAVQAAQTRALYERLLRGPPA